MCGNGGLGMHYIEQSKLNRKSLGKNNKCYQKTIANNYLYNVGCKRLDTDFFNFLEVATSEKRCAQKKNRIRALDYIYQYKDHLQNVRLSYSDSNNDGSINPANEIREENSYYPFGLKMKGFNNVVTGRDHKYGYGNKEEQLELGLDWIDITARNYDPALGRWMNIDPLADAKGQIHNTPYGYAMNNPIHYTDPDGNCPPGIDCETLSSMFSPKALSRVGEARSRRPRYSRDGVSTFKMGLSLDVGTKSFTPVESTVTPTADVTAGSASFMLSFGMDSSGSTSSEAEYSVKVGSASTDVNIAGLQLAKADVTAFEFSGVTSLENGDTNTQVNVLNGSSMTVIPEDEDDLTAKLSAVVARIEVNITEAGNNIKDAGHTFLSFIEGQVSHYFNQSNSTKININPL